MPPKAQPNPNPLGLSARELELAMLAWKCLDEDGKVPHVNPTKLAALANIGKPDSAARMWRTIKNKIEGATVGVGPSAPAAPAAPAAEATGKKKATTGVGKNRGKKRGKKDVDTDEDDDTDAKETKVAKSNMKKKLAKHAKVEEEPEDDDH